MNDFDYDVMQKKRIAASAAKRVGKRRKVTLPHDYWTAAQKKGLNGPMVSYRMNDPVSYDEFKIWPTDIQKMYLAGLKDRYKLNGSMLAEMFGISRNTACRTLKTLGIICRKGENRNGKYDEAWQAFLHGEKVPVVEEIEPEPSEEITPEPAETEVNPTEEEEALFLSGFDSEPDEAVVESMNLNMRGTISQILTRLSLVLENLPDAEFSIKLEVQAR